MAPLLSAERLPLTAIVLVRDEEVNIEFCLASIREWCGEILVVDSGSTDRTVELCSRYTGRIFFHAFEDSASQWTWALEHLPIRYEWVLPLDADHVVSGELRDDLARVLKVGSHRAYYSRHQYVFWGVPMRGFKQVGLRVFQKTAASVDPGERVDYKFHIRGTAGMLQGTLYEYNRKELSLDFWMAKHQKFSSRIAAEEVLRAGMAPSTGLRPRLFGSPDERIAWMKTRWRRMPLFVRPLLYFGYRYFVRRGFLDGRVGFLYHFMQAFWYRTLIDIKIAGIRRQIERGGLSLDQLRESLGK